MSKLNLTAPGQWLKLSPSALLKYEACPKQYRYKYVEGWSPSVTGPNLVFGTALHASLEAVMRNQVDQRGRDPLAAFEGTFREEIARKPLEIKGDKVDLDEMMATGLHLAGNLAARWASTGFTPLLAPNGDVMVEYEMEVELIPGVKLSCILDTAVLDGEGDIALVDFKSVKAPTSMEFAVNSDQLGMQQEVFTGNREFLGLTGDVGKIGFMEATKNRVPKVEFKKDGSPKKQTGEGPKILKPEMLEAHSTERMAEFRQKWTWIAESILEGRFPARPQMAWNSPCSMCDYRLLCTKGDSTGLIKKSLYIDGGPRSPRPSPFRPADRLPGSEPAPTQVQQLKLT